MESSLPTQSLDIAIIGAGFAGLYMLHRARQEGFVARAFEAGSDVGGTWFWNRYPGARCDVDSLDYSYSFSDELQRSWRWSERYAAQPEILRYIHHVADFFDLRKDIELDTRIASAVFDEATDRWTVTSEAGATITARFVVMATGVLSVTSVPDVPGLEDFEGRWYHTGYWPQEPVDFTGKRVAVVGTGSSGIQTITEVAKKAASLTVFQRTAHFAVPARNGPLPDDEIDAYRENFQALRQVARTSQYGTAKSDAMLLHRSALVDADDVRHALFEARWKEGGIALVRSYDDLLTDVEANRTASEFVAGKVGEIVKDPDTAALLKPKDYHIGTKRVCLDTGYYESFNLPHVKLVDLKTDPIVRIVPEGIATQSATHAFDAIVFATGFDAVTGSILRVDPKGRDGVSLSSKWSGGPRAYLGLMANGYPNMFFVNGPGSPSAVGNCITNIEQHVDWIADCVKHLRERGRNTIDATEDAETAWAEHVYDLASKTLMHTADSWWLGANIPGKPRVFMAYLGGTGRYREVCDDIAAEDYKGFEIA